MLTASRDCGLFVFPHVESCDARGSHHVSGFGDSFVIELCPRHLGPRRAGSAFPSMAGQHTSDDRTMGCEVLMGGCDKSLRPTWATPSDVTGIDKARLA